MLEETHLADPPPDPDTDDGGAGHNRRPAPGTPRWVTVVGIAVLVLVLLFVILHVTGLVGPHMHGAGLGRDTPVPRVIAQGLPHLGHL